MNLTNLGERLIRGDLIETFKIVNGEADYGKDIFRLSRSGNNMFSRINLNLSNCKSISKLRSSFLSDRIKNCWNCLPLSVTQSSSVNYFKANLESFKQLNTSKYISNRVSGHYFWEISDSIINKIEGNVET